MPDTLPVRKINNALLKWFDAHQREMPWRTTKDPYKIWVSEIMLQQTQVKTVIPYYQRWMKAFPDVKTLARAPLSKVLKFWEGLGYYSRARNLHKAAKVIVKDWDHQVPETLEDIQTLPGIGRYTAGAVLSIAYHQRVPVLDGNVKRVVSRLFRLKENGATPKSEQRLWDRAEMLVPKSRPGDFNQALMELGATVCVPKNPMCLLCPLSKLCEARLKGNPEKFPPARNRVPATKIEVSAAVIEKRGKTFIQQRPLDGMMGGLWEFPGGKLEKGESPERCLHREIKEELGVEVDIIEKMMTIQHTYTQFRVTLHVFRCRLPKGRIQATQCEQWKWVKNQELSDFPFPAANVKIVNRLSKNGGQTQRD